jgi:hypothetical protein
MEIIFLFFLVGLTYSISPAVVSSSVSNKTVVFQGVQHNYLTYEVDFDQEVYFVDNWVCPCFTNRTVRPVVGVSVDAIELEKNKIEEETIDDQTVLYKFYLSEREGYSAVKIYLANHWGETTGYVGVGRVPSPSDYDFINYAKARDSIWVCPTEQAWNFGWWYVLAIRNEPYPHNHFQISWNTERVVTCTGVENNNNLLKNNVGYYGVAKFFEYQYFRFWIPGRCSNFAVSVKQTTMDFGDVDLYVSLNYTQPNIDHHDYASQNNGNDVVALMDICGDENGWFVYIGIYSWQGSEVPFVLTATVDHGFNLRPVLELPAQQFLYTFAYGQASLECGQSESREEVRCEFYAYAGCLDPYDIWNCCARFGFLPPHSSTNPWVVTPSAASGGKYKPLPWNLTRLPVVLDNVPKRLSFVQYLSKSSATSGRRFTHPNCRVRLNNMLTNSQGEVLPELIEFERSNEKCVSSGLVDGLIEQMGRETDLDRLKLLDLQLSAETNKREFVGCERLLDSLVLSRAETQEYTTTYCDLGPSQFEYYLDPCCSWNLTLFEPCLPRTTRLETKTAYRIIEDFPCSDCAKKSLEGYLKTKKKDIECIKDWTEAVGTVDQLTTFAYDCSVKLFGPFESIGRACSSDSDCFYSSKCDLQYGRCDHTINNLKTCLWENADPYSLEALFNYWEIPEELTEDRFYAQLSSYERPLCTGPGSLGFRPHYAYLLTLPNCVDSCVENNVTVLCYDTSTKSCPKDQICPPGSSTNCYRFFQFFEGSREDCGQERILDGCYDCTNYVSNNGTCNYLNLNETECSSQTVQEACSLPRITTKDECVKTVYCDGLQELEEYIYPLTEACFATFGSDFYGTPMCGLDYADNPWGCLTNDTRETCSGRWFDLSICNETKACYTSYFSYQPKDVCEGEWKSFFQPRSAEWVVSESNPRIWNPRVGRSVKQDFDVFSFHQDTKKAVGKLVSLNYQKSAVCRIKAKNDIFKILACGCSDGKDCYDDGRQTTLESNWVCPFSETKVETELVSFSVPRGSVPVESFCQVFKVDVIPASFYRTVPGSRLSSQAFTENSINQWSVLKEKGFVIEGQIVSDAFSFSWNYTSLLPVQVCIRPGIEERSSLFGQFGIARVHGKKIKKFTSEIEVREGGLCFAILEPSTYVAVLTRESPYESLLIQASISSVFYWILFGGVLYQVLNIVLGKPKRWKMKLSFAFLSGVFLVIRGTYFIVFPLGVTDPTVSYIFFELPTFLFMIMDSAIVFLWVEITYTVKRLEPSKKFSRTLFSYWAVWNLFILACFVGFIVAHYYSREQKEQDCSLLDLNLVSEKDLIVNRVYVCFVSFICLALGISMMVSGYNLVKPHLGHQTTSRSKNVTKFLMWTWGLMSVFAVTFLIRSILMVVAVFTNLIVPIIVFCLLEQAATAVLLYYLRPDLSKQLRSWKSGSGSKSPRHTTSTAKSATVTSY